MSNSMNTQDSQSELRETLKDFTYNLKVDTPDGFESKTVVDLEEALYQFKSYVTTRVKEAEKKGVAWTIGIIDEMHEMDIEKNGGVRDSQYKGIKNGIRAMYEQDTGNGDPAPNYPINVALTTTTNGKEE